MKIHTIAWAAAAAFVLATSGAASAATPAAKHIEGASDLLQVRGGHGHGHAHGHRGRHHGWHGNRGLHRGWYVGHHRGWSHSRHRHHW